MVMSHEAELLEPQETECGEDGGERWDAISLAGSAPSRSGSQPLFLLRRTQLSSCSASVSPAARLCGRRLASFGGGTLVRRSQTKE